MLPFVVDKSQLHTTAWKYPSRSMQLPKAGDSTGREHYRWLVDNLRAKARPHQEIYPPTTAAKEADIWPSTITEFLKDHQKNPDSDRTLHAKTIDKLCLQFGWERPVRGGTDPTKTIRGVRNEGEPFNGAHDPDLERAIEALVGRRPAATPWTLKTRALELRGYMPGDIVIVDLGRLPEPGEVAVAQIFSKTGPEAETVFRIFDPPCLMSATLDQALQKPFYLDPQWVTVKGVVSQLIRVKKSQQ